MEAETEKKNVWWSTNSKVQSLIRLAWQWVSQFLFFMSATTCTLVFGYFCLTGMDILSPNPAISSIDWQNKVEVRIFLWSFAGVVAIGIALGTYLIDDWKAATLFGAGLFLYWIGASQTVVEVALAIFSSVFVGLLAGYGLCRVTQSKAPQALARISGRLWCMFLTTIIIFLYCLSSSEQMGWTLVFAAIFYFLKMGFYGTGSILRLHWKAETDIEKERNELATA